MQKRTALYGVGLVILVLWLLRSRVTYQTAFAPKVKVADIPNVKYNVGDISYTDPTKPEREKFDWFNGEQCGCGSSSNIQVIDSVHFAAYPTPVYPVAAIPEIPPALKGVPSLAIATPPPSPPEIALVPYVPAPPPDPPVYTPPIPTYWFDFKSPYNKHSLTSRNGTNMIVGYAAIWTSDGGYIPAAGDGWQIVRGNTLVNPYSMDNLPPDGGYRDPDAIQFSISINGRIFARDSSKDVFR